MILQRYIVFMANEIHPKCSFKIIVDQELWKLVEILKRLEKLRKTRIKSVKRTIYKLDIHIFMCN